MNIWNITRALLVLTLLPLVYSFVNGIGCDFRFYGINSAMKTHMNIQCHASIVSAEITTSNGEVITDFEGTLFRFTDEYFYILLREIKSHENPKLLGLDTKGIKLYKDVNFVRGYIYSNEGEEAIVMLYRPERYIAKGRLLGDLGW
ncbi:hypothetical protein [Shewanella atlantica]|uniref:Uncharacterized protein n=1 Tax=Shewanella atlantica TaxID=271099 RepID=A0A431VS92_9GAMM|nr:hypothetical protein [Shewanella atlantica]RTR26080.1 hypothetical protein EKG39_22445 [Shewanella atlantica]